MAKELGAPGTPTIIIGNLVKNVGQGGIFGYPGITKLAKAIEDLYVY